MANSPGDHIIMHYAFALRGNPAFRQDRNCFELFYFGASGGDARETALPRNPPNAANQFSPERTILQVELPPVAPPF